MDPEVGQKLASYITASILKQPGRQLDPSGPLLSSGLVDSFSLVDLALFIEDTFGVHIDDTELNPQTFDTLDQLAALVEARRGQ